MKKALIIGAGPIQNSAFLQDVKDMFFIACDGGYLTYQKEGIEPDLFIGDFDTLSPSILKHPKEVITLNQIKDDTDTLFAIKTALERGYDTFYIYGCLGGKIEHSIANIQLLSYLENHHAKGYLYSEDQKTVLFTLSNESITFSKEAKGYISVFSLTDKTFDVSEYNLKYTLFKHELSSSFPLGISNEFIEGKEAKIEVGEGILLIVCPAFSLPKIK